MDKQDIFKILNTIFTNEDFMLEIATYGNRFIFGDLMNHLNTILCYYLTTRESRILPFEEIERNYSTIKDKLPSKEHLNNILMDGYLTHSFPGVEKKYVQDYGFDYFDKLSLDEISKLQIIRDSLIKLEKNLEECWYFTQRKKNNSQKDVDKELFMTFPGTKTIYYSAFSPERLYKGPIDLKLFENFPIVVGETKKDYLMRIIKYRIIEYEYKKEFKEEILEASNIVLDYYSEKNCIAFIPIKKIIDIPIFNCMYKYDYGGEVRTIKRFCERIKARSFCLKDIFTCEMYDVFERNDRGNFVTLSSFIDKDSISLVDFLDWYNLRQVFLKRIGLPQGTLVSYNDCREIKRKDEISEDIKILYKSRG